MKLSVNFSKRSIHLWPSVLAELTVEDDDCLRFHKIFNGCLVAEEESLHLLWGIQIHGALDVASLVLVVKSAVDYQVRAFLL